MERAQAQFSAIVALDGYALVRKVGLLREAATSPLAGRMAALLDVSSMLPRQVWYEPESQAHDQQFWQRALTHLELRTARAQGAALEAAWYKEHRASCGTPHGIALQVVVPANLIVRLSSHAEVAALKGFKPVGKPSLICPYFVQKLIPVE